MGDTVKQSILFTIIFLIYLASEYIVFSNTTPPSKTSAETAIFLDVFEVKVKKNDPGLIWEPKIFLSSQAIPFEVSDSPEAWNGAWFEKMKNEPKE